MVHLVTAADGASAFYSTETNEHRYESPEEAILLDKRTQRVWNGHPCHIIIDNRHDSFEAKLVHTQLWIESLLGLSEDKTLHIHSIRLSASTFSLSSIPVPSEDIKFFAVKETFLDASVVECLLRTDVPSFKQQSDSTVCILERSCGDHVSHWLKLETNTGYLLRRVLHQRFSEYLLHCTNRPQVTLFSVHCFVWDDTACVLSRQINEETRNEFEWRFSYHLRGESPLISRLLGSYVIN